MTSPLPTAPSAASVNFEQWVASVATADLKRQVIRANRQITALYVALAGNLNNPIPANLQRTFADQVVRILQAIQYTGQQELAQLVNQGLHLGAQEAAMSGVVTAATSATPQLDQWTGTLVTTITDRIVAALTAAKAAPHIGPLPLNKKDLDNILALAYRAVTLLERDARWATNAAINQGVLESVNAADVPRVWVNEWGACLHCLAYAGEVAQPNQPYRSGLTYYVDPNGRLKPITQGVVWGPPLHPNCRCRQEPYLGSFGYPIHPWETRETSVSEALKREARRQVLQGRSGSDSQPARLRAASDLLTVGAGLPSSVQQKARAAVWAGRFKHTNRTLVP